MPPRLGLFTNRQRARSFGAAAHAYDTHRPRYPDELIDHLLSTGARRVLDVGAGTGIASEQLAARGADVLAVEPDERMAATARAKGIEVEIATFEQWDPAGRIFDLVVFAASFHWVDPATALPKILEILSPGGRLALIWNRQIPVSPSREDFEVIYRDYYDTNREPGDRDAADLLGLIASTGYTVEQRSYAREVHYTGEEWVDLAFTYSNQLILPADKAAELRARLLERIGSAGVLVGGDALAVLATPERG